MHRTPPVALVLLLTCVVALAASGAPAQNPSPRAVTPEHTITLTRLQGFDLSPDGAWVLYAAGRMDYPASDRAVSHIYRGSAAGGPVRQMTASDAGESASVWSPADGGEGVRLGKLTIAPGAASPSIAWT
jgi:hypothetical protein